MSLVVDASAMVDFLIVPVSLPGLHAALRDNELHAPSLIDFEVASALRGHVLGHRLTTARARRALEDFAALYLHRHAMTNMLGDVLGLMKNVTAYDASYVVLAQALDVPLLTADATLAEARKLGVEVQLIA